jgi:hypothetical protein
MKSLLGSCVLCCLVIGCQRSPTKVDDVAEHTLLQRPAAPEARAKEPAPNPPSADPSPKKQGSPGQSTMSSDLEKYPDIAYRERAFQLFRFLALDKQNEKGFKPSSEEFQRMDRAVTLISLELTEAGVFINLDKPLRKERLEGLSPAARAFYDYYRQALAHNPVFRDLYKPLPVNKAQLYLSYRNYQLQGRSDGERRTFEAAASVLDDTPP